ncbi:hypothetical protein JCM6882_006523 [Rhodosporidiobolus microsporus]
MDSLGGFYDPSTSTPRPSTPVQQQQQQSAQSGPAAGTPLAASSTTASDEAATVGAGEQGAGAGAGASGGGGLEKEVANVMSGFGLGGFWGKVRKQADTAIQSAQAEYTKAQKDLTPLLSRAQAQLDTLSAQTKAELARLSEPAQAGEGQRVVVGPDGGLIVVDEVEKKEKEEVVFDEAEGEDGAEGKKDDVKGKGVDRGEGPSTAAMNDASSAASQEQIPAAAASAFFRSLSTAPQFQSLSRDLHSLQTNLSSNLTNLQTQLSHLDVAGELKETQKLAEGYLHKGEGWLADFSKEVGKLAKDAVRVVPPTGTGAGDRLAGSGTAVQSGLSRRELLLYRLRTDPSILLVDPALPPPPSSAPDVKDTREAYAAFVASLQSTLDGFDTPQFREKVAAELEEGGEALAALKERLTSASGEGEGEEGGLSEEAFWGRYFFRKGEIEEEEGRRKRVLQVAEQSDDDFSWDMDDEESNAPSLASPPLSAAHPTTASSAPPPSAQPAAPAPAPSAPAPAPASAPAPAPAAPAPAAAPSTPASPSAAKKEEERSPRASSDTTTASSFDVVGERSGQPSDDDEEAHVEPSRPVVKGDQEEAKKSGTEEKKVESDEDSDWE